MAEKKSCKALIIGRASAKASLKPPKSSYFIIINFNRGSKNSSARNEAAKVRIRIPKLLAKTIKRTDRNASERNSKNAKKKHFVKKIASLFGKGEKVVRNKGNGPNGDDLDEEGTVEDQSPGSKAEKFYESASDESKLFVSTTVSSINSDESEEEEGKEIHQVSNHALSLTSKIPTTTSRNGGNCSGRVGGMWRASSFPGGVLKSLMKQKAMQKQCSSGIKRSGNEEVKDEERADRFELCKKQILKGGKCRPLTLTWSPSIRRGKASTADLPNNAFYSE
ncbi:hypothetical protein Sjap_007381 [Stephania japonica]|uniref:Uncharacterized protein n=1 Tax=Stephania japonica TaxID=461633 RepID=A0AAP0JPW9_9MAGN